MNFLSSIAKPFTSIFHFLASPKGRAIISAGEAVVATVDPALLPLINLANSWMDKVVTTEQLAEAAGVNSGTGPQKAAAVMSAMGPEIAKYFPNATATEIANANTAIVAFLQAFSTPAAPGATIPVTLAPGQTLATAVSGAGVGQK